MRGRVVTPVGEQVVGFPERQLIDFVEHPSGSGCDMAVEEGPVR